MKASISRWLALSVCGLSLLGGAGTALGGGDRHGRHDAADDRRPSQARVLAPDETPSGYSLADMARLTAAFNVGNRLGALPNTPFQILYQAEGRSTTFRVGQGTVLYLPLLYNDDSAPVIGRFPDPADTNEVLRYWYSQSRFGALTTADVLIDGQRTELGGRYVAGASFALPLPDGATRYLTQAVFIAGLSPGRHTIEYRGRATGDDLRTDTLLPYFADGFFPFTGRYTVIVH